MVMDVESQERSQLLIVIFIIICTTQLNWQWEIYMELQSSIRPVVGPQFTIFLLSFVIRKCYILCTF